MMHIHTINNLHSTVQLIYDISNSVAEGTAGINRPFAFERNPEDFFSLGLDSEVSKRWVLGIELGADLAKDTVLAFVVDFFLV